MTRIFVVLGLVLGLSACTDATQDLANPVEPLGDFKLGHNIVLAPNPEKYLVTTEASKEELIAAVEQQMDKRFRRFNGDKFYHFGISVEAYSLPPPVVPGRTFLAMRVTVWDDAAQAKLNEETELISAVLFVETRLANTRQESLRLIAAEAAKQTENWLRRQMDEEGWFKTAAPAPVAQTVAAAE